VNFRTLDLNLLRVFDRVMAEGSLTRAAASLSMTQPAVSHAVKRLHEAVGEALFVRSAFGMTPTARAEALWPQVRTALVMLQQSLAPDAFDAQQDAMNFQLVMSDATAALLGPALVSAIESQQALANLRLVPLITRDPRRMVEQGEVDMAIGHFPAAITALVAEGGEASLRHTRLYDTHYVCVMRRGHPLAERTLTLDDFCAAHHLLVSFSGRPHGFVDQALIAMGRQRRIVLTVNQFFTAARVVRQSDLLTLLPASFLGATGHEHDLVARELPLDLHPVSVDMIWHRRRDTDPAHRWLRTLVRDAAEASHTPTPAALASSPSHPPMP
jgi:DNA-binding transcriptional LysR family regulator